MKKHNANPVSLKAPRAIEDLQKLAGELTFKLGNAQYTLEVYRKEVEGLVEALEGVNKEAAARKELDAKEQK